MARAFLVIASIAPALLLRATVYSKIDTGDSMSVRFKSFDVDNSWTRMRSRRDWDDP